jgi:hypothetical protein
MNGLALREEIVMQTKMAELQPRDPAAARLGNIAGRVVVLMVVLVAAASYLRG